MRNITILGSTGSIGMQALEVIRSHPGEFKVDGLACNSNIERLKRQIDVFKPSFAAVYDKKMAEKLADEVDIQIFSGEMGLAKLAKNKESDILLNSLVGSIGIEPTIEAIRAKKTIALANKETLVAAGEIVMDLAAKNNVSMIPIDSEHSAIFQCINADYNRTKEIKRLIITCSGGAFRDRTREELPNLTAKEALNHPNWNMGNKITIDCATLMNKGFEVIEAKMLFGLDYNNIDVVIHPQSIIHSFVEFNDTSVLAQLGWPDMKVPIQYALSQPKRWKNNLRSLDLLKVSKLTFDKPDMVRFPCLGYAYDAGRIGGSMPCVLNAANEIAVKLFLEDKIKFTDISRLVNEQMQNHKLVKNPELDDILKIDRGVKAKVNQIAR